MSHATALPLLLSLLLAACAAPLAPYHMALDQQDDYRTIQHWLRERQAAPPPATAPRVALLADAGTWPAGAKAIVAALESAGTPCRVQDHSLLTTGNLQPFDVLILPGGWAPLQQTAATDDGLRAIQSFVENGGTCVGVCAGAYLLSQNVRWEGSTYSHPLALFDGTADGPINNYPTAQSVHLTLTAAGQRAGLPANRSYYLNGGCSLLGGTNVTVLATFPNQTPAIISRPVGKGRIVLLAIHPEIAAPPASAALPAKDAAAIYRALLAE